MTIKIINKRTKEIFNCLIDDEDYDLVKDYDWHFDEYVYCFINSVKKYIHRFILGITESKILTDHINHNTLDNRKCNLRKCNRLQNSTNRTPRGKSKYLGVCFHKCERKYFSKKKNKIIQYQYPPRFMASITVNGKKKHLGNFDLEIEAAKAYDKAAKEHFGEFSNLNFK